MGYLTHWAIIPAAFPYVRTGWWASLGRFARLGLVDAASIAQPFILPRSKSADSQLLLPRHDPDAGQSLMTSVVVLNSHSNNLLFAAA